MLTPHDQKLFAHCPLCYTVYHASEIHQIGERGAIRVFHCTCSACGNAILAIVLKNFGAMSSVGLVTDLEVQDALRLRNAENISSDECIAMHRLLETESQLFCQRLLDKTK